MFDIKQFVIGAGLCLTVAAGCGGPANEYDAIVTGTVTIDGELADSGVITFHPTGDGKIAIGRVHPDGSYSLRTGQGDLTKIDGGTVKSGEYIATVSINAPARVGDVVGEGGPPIAGPSLVAAKYASKETSDLKQTVNPGPQVIVLELERAEVMPAAGEEDTAADGQEAVDGEAAALEVGSDTDANADGDETSTASPADTPSEADPESGKDATTTKENENP